MTLKLVFVDDEEELGELYEEYFVDVGHEVVTFADPLEAEAYLNNNPVDLCFIDYRMPVIDGLELRTRIPATLHCYLLSGELELDCPQGFEGKLQKPIRIEQIEAIIDACEAASGNG